MFTVMLIPVDLLKPHPDNKEIPPLDENIHKKMLEDIRENGITTPLILAKDYTILAGHQRWKIAKELGMKYVPAIVRQDIDSDSPEATALLIKDNLLRRHYNPMQIAKMIRMLKEKYVIRKGNNQFLGGASAKIAEAANLPERTIRQFDKLNDLIPPLQELVSANKLGHTAAYSLAFLLPEEQERLLAVLGESGVCGLSVSEAQELRKELDSLRKEKESLLEQISKLQEGQKEVDELRARLRELEANPVERVVEKVVCKVDPTLEAELEAARKQNSELLKEKEWVESRLQELAREKERKEAKLSVLEQEVERLQRHLDEARRELEKEKSRPKPPQWSKEHLEFQGLLQEATRHAASLATALKNILEKHSERLLAAARVHGSPDSDMRETAEVLGDALMFKAFSTSLNVAVSASVEVWELLEPGRPKLKVVKGTKGVGSEET